MSLTDEPGERRGLLPRFTLKDSNTFLLTDALGDIQGCDDGLFTNDTRVLSRFELSVHGRSPSLLGAAINQDRADNLRTLDEQRHKIHAAGRAQAAEIC